MPPRPRNRQVTPSQPPLPNHPIDTGSTQQTRARVPAVAPEQEYFELDNVSGDDDDDYAPNTEPTDNPNDTAVQRADARIQVNDPTPPKHNSKAAHDIEYFFDKTDKKSTVCKECKNLEPSKLSSVHYIYSRASSNTTLRHHLDKYHQELYLSLVEEKGWKNQLPSILSQVRSQGASEAAGSQEGEGPDNFDESTFQQRLLNFMIVEDQPLRLVDCPEFRSLLLLLRRNLKESMIPHQTKLTELVIQAWRQYFVVLKRELAASMGQISLTTDTWSDQNRRSYLALTAHWIARVPDTNALTLKTALIAFHRLRGGHDGNLQGKVILALLDRADITAKVGHFTTDNASNMKTTMDSISSGLKDREMRFDAADRHVMCFPHTIELSSRQVILSVDAKAIGEAREGEDDGQSSRHGEAIPSDSPGPIALARSVVGAIRSSGLRRDAFDEMVKDGNKKSWFKQGDPPEIVQLPCRQLLRDVRTRWDSVYHMLNRLREMRPAVDHFLALPNNSDLAKYRISPLDWSVMQDIEVVLSVPHVVQQMMSGESTPILSGSIPAFETFMTKWEKIIQDHPRLRSTVQPGLDWAYQYYRRMDRTKAYVVAMFLNPAMCMSWISKHWEKEYADLAEKNIKELMYEYREKNTPGGNTVQSTEQNLGSEDMPKYMSLAMQYGIGEDMDIGGASKSVQSVEHEYQAYVTASLSSKNVDILKFWEMNSTTYPTLFATAMDYLPIQASAVPCERIFSSSAETDTKKRNRISPLVMEALQMLKFHLKKDRLNFMAGWLTSEKQMVEDDTDEDLLQSLLEGNYQDSLDSIIRAITNGEA